MHILPNNDLIASTEMSGDGQLAICNSQVAHPVSQMRLPAPHATYHRRRSRCSTAAGGGLRDLELVRETIKGHRIAATAQYTECTPRNLNDGFSSCALSAFLILLGSRLARSLIPVVGTKMAPMCVAFVRNSGIAVLLHFICLVNTECRSPKFQLGVRYLKPTMQVRLSRPQRLLSELFLVVRLSPSCPLRLHLPPLDSKFAPLSSSAIIVAHSLVGCVPSFHFLLRMLIICRSSRAHL